jgi:predicted Rdx family selenoprotein
VSYAAQADLSKDRDFIERIAACAAVEAANKAGNFPLRWAEENVWKIAASPGFAAAYESAQVSEVVRPGRDAGVITDGMLLATVQPLAQAAL